MKLKLFVGLPIFLSLLAIGNGGGYGPSGGSDSRVPEIIEDVDIIKTGKVDYADSTYTDTVAKATAAYPSSNPSNFVDATITNDLNTVVGTKYPSSNPSNFVGATITNDLNTVVGTKVSTNATGQLNWTGADVRIADATQSNQPVTKAQADLTYVPRTGYIVTTQSVYVANPVEGYIYQTNTYSFVRNGTLQKINFTSQVPISATAAELVIRGVADTTGKTFQFNAIATSNSSSVIFRTVAASLIHWGSGSVELDANGECYYINNLDGTATAEHVRVKGWWQPVIYTNLIIIP